MSPRGASPDGGSANTCAAGCTSQAQHQPLPDAVPHGHVELQQQNLPVEEQGLGNLAGVPGALEVVKHFLQLSQLGPYGRDSV